MESAFLTPAPTHATTETRAAAAACDFATASHAAAPPPSAHALAAPRRMPTDSADESADEETATADQGNDGEHNPRGAKDAQTKGAEAGAAADALSDEDIEAVIDPKGILGHTDGRYNEALLRRAGSPTRADPGWAERPPPDGYQRVAGAVILCKRRRAGDASHETPPPADYDQDADDDSSWAQAVLEMEAELEEYEEHIERPPCLEAELEATMSHRQGRLHMRRQHANRRSHNYDYGDPFARQAAAHILEDGDGSESDDQDFDDERVQYAPRPSQVRPRIKDSMLTAGLRMRDSAQLQLYHELY